MGGALEAVGWLVVELEEGHKAQRLATDGRILQSTWDQLRWSRVLTSFGILQAPTRVETDAFGPINVETDKYWGAQTQR